MRWGIQKWRRGFLQADGTTCSGDVLRRTERLERTVDKGEEAVSKIIKN
jgi:hypothetical protein